jgi:hypothetical protein
VNRAPLDAAATAFDSLRNGIQHIGSMNDPSAGAIRIGGQEALISPLMPMVFARLHRERNLDLPARPIVMAGLGPAIHVCVGIGQARRGCRPASA